MFKFLAMSADRRASVQIEGYGSRRSSAQVLDSYGAARMSKAFVTSGARAEFPPVKLDRTLYDFLQEELKHGEPMEAHCGFKPHSGS